MPSRRAPLPLPALETGACLATLVAGVVLARLVPELRTVAMVPLTATAAMLAPDVARMVVGRVSVLGPWSACVLGQVFALVVSPIAYLVTGDPIVPLLRGQDLRPALTAVAWSAMPLPLVLRIGYRWGLRLMPARAARPMLLNPRRAAGVAIALTVVGAICHAAVAYVYRPALLGRTPEGLLGLTAGSVVLLADLGNVALVLLLYVALRRLGTLRHYAAASVAFLLAGLTLLVLMNAYRQSRWFLLFFVVWAASAYERQVRRIPGAALVLAGILLIVPLTHFKLFRTGDFTSWSDYMSDAERRATEAERYQVTPMTTLAADLGRYNVWMLYYRQAGHASGVEWQYGRTIAAALLQPFPRWLIGTKPPGMLELTTDAEYGRGAYRENAIEMGRVGGVWAEGYVNFGVPGVWLLGILYGVMLGWLTAITVRAPNGTVAHFCYGAIVLTGFQLVMTDSFLIVWNLARLGVWALVVFVATRSWGRRERQQPRRDSVAIRPLAPEAHILVESGKRRGGAGSRFPIPDRSRVARVTPESRLLIPDS